MSQILNGHEQGFWVITDGSQIWLNQGELPHGKAHEFNLTNCEAFVVGEYGTSPVWLVTQTRSSGMYSPRQLLDTDIELFQLIGKAVQLSEFHTSHRFCGYCSTIMHPSRTEWAMLCHNKACRQRYYPQIAPSIIVAIRREDKILLAKHTKHRNDIYTVLAGFVEVGERVEQAVSREVKEECGIEIKNIRYVSSQPWPFPHSLMLAFMADYAQGEILCDTKEILHADWYDTHSLPNLPPYGTIARRLIEDTLVLCRNDN
ncbi:NAD(+) diphosphatase [Thorsellia anophelis]|uniref:NAD(+) diphosphatase n=1 Tax=Thorsellia anophelis TaxID=336804 RepID=UPI000B85CEF3|nr:NAD(+) diphosphatase [Thorsellia anophelis]